MRTHQVFPGARVTNDRCLWLENQETIVIADLHIGLESALEADGLHFPRFQTEDMRESLIEIMDRYSPKRVVILGDLKHDFSRNVGQELAEVTSVLSLLKESAEVCLARGNHDNYLVNIAFKLGIEVEESFIIGGISMMHGHVRSDARPLVIGHEHPSVKVFDEVRAYVRLPCFLHFEEERILVLPAFSPLAPGTDFTSSYGSRAFSPSLHDAELGRAKVYACSEIGLLPLGDLDSLSNLRERPRHD
ncbi:MAG: metallophosphoesterase [Methanomassiliicoccales archaeon]